MISRPTLKTERMILRPFVIEDAADVQRLAGDKEIAATTLNIPHPYLDGMAEEWIATHEIDFKDKRSITFAMTSAETGELIGSISLRLVLRHNNAEMGYWVGVPYWGKGYCTEAASAVLRYAFEEIELNRVFAHYLTTNSASGRVMDKIGMLYEGHLRQHVNNRGEFSDLYVYGICRSDYIRE